MGSGSDSFVQKNLSYTVDRQNTIHLHMCEGNRHLTF